jgi:hypothetical protein
LAVGQDVNFIAQALVPCRIFHGFKQSELSLCPLRSLWLNPPGKFSPTDCTDKTRIQNRAVALIVRKINLATRNHWQHWANRKLETKRLLQTVAVQPESFRWNSNQKFLFNVQTDPLRDGFGAGSETSLNWKQRGAAVGDK